MGPCKDVARSVLPLVLSSRDMILTTERPSSGKIKNNWRYTSYLLAYLVIYLLTYSMEESPSLEANWFSASQVIPRILWNPKVHYRIHK